MNFNDLNKYQKARVIASGCTAIVVLIILIFMLNVYLSREIPQLEEGLEVMLGMENAGAEDFFEPTPASEIAQELQEVSSPETASDPAPSDEAYQTQNIEESVHMKDQKTEEELKKEKEAEEKRKKELAEKEAEQRRLTEEKRRKEEQQRREDSISAIIAQRTQMLRGGGGNGANASGGTGGGSTAGTKGNPFGNDRSKNTEGSSNSGDNNSYSLHGRSPVGQIALPTYSEQVEGRVVISIIVDKNGNVIEASRTKGTTVDDAKVMWAAIKAAKKTRFNPIDQDKNQSGIITYELKLK